MPKIEQSSSEMIEELENMHKKCLELANSRKTTIQSIDDFKANFEELKSKFDSFEIDDRKCEHILSECKELKEMLESVLYNY